MKALKLIASILAVFTFVYYQYVYVNTGVKLNELYFICSGLSVSAFSFMSIKWKDPVFVTSVQLLCSSFFLVVVFMYVYRWVIVGDGSTNYYTAACISAVLTFLYSTYHVIRRNPYIKRK